MKLPKNARGGYKVTGVGASAAEEPIAPVDRPGVYCHANGVQVGTSKQCAEGRCGHKLSKRHWKPKLKKAAQ